MRKVEKINLFKFNPEQKNKITIDKICKDLLGSSEINIDTIYSNCIEMVTDENLSEMMYLYMNSPLKVTKPIDEFIFELQNKKIKNIFKELKKYKFYATVTTQGNKLNVYINTLNIKYPPKNFNFEKLGIEEFYGKKTIQIFIIGKSGMKIDIAAANSDNNDENSDTNIELPQISIDRYFDLYNNLNELSISDRNIYNKQHLSMANYNLDLLKYYIDKQFNLLRNMDERVLTKFKNDRFNIFSYVDFNSTFSNNAIEYKRGKFFKDGSQKLSYMKLNAVEALAKNTNILKEKYENSALDIFKALSKKYNQEDCVYIYMNSCFKYIFSVNMCIECLRSSNSNISVRDLFNQYYFYAKKYNYENSCVKGSISANIEKMNCSVNPIFNLHICLNYISFKIIEYDYGAVKLGSFRYSKVLNKSEALIKFEELLIKYSNSDNTINMKIEELEDIGNIEEFSNPDFVTEAQYNLLLEDYQKNYKKLFMNNLKQDNISNIVKFLKKFEKNNYLNANNNIQYMDNNHELRFYNFKIALPGFEKNDLKENFLECIKSSDFKDVLYIYNNSIIKNVIELEEIIEIFNLQKHNFEHEASNKKEVTYENYYFNNYITVGIKILERLGEGHNNPEWILNSISNFIKCIPSRRLNKLFYENKNKLEDVQEGIYDSESIKKIIEPELLKTFYKNLRKFAKENFKSYQFENENSMSNLNYIYNNTILKMLYTYDEFKLIIMG